MRLHDLHTVPALFCDLCCVWMHRHPVARKGVPERVIWPVVEVGGGVPGFSQSLSTLLPSIPVERMADMRDGANRTCLLRVRHQPLPKIVGDGDQPAAGRLGNRGVDLDVTACYITIR